MAKNKSLIDENGLRVDGRKFDELRPLEMKVGVIKRANGSALVKHGGNQILCAVYGPREVHPKHLALSDKLLIRAEYRLATFSVGDRKSPAPRRREHELSKIISEALEPSIFVERFPRAVVDIYINVIDADGGTRCASITAASLALADAGIPLKGIVSSVAAGKVDGKIVLDLCDVEDKDGDGDLPVAMISTTKDITLCQLDGNFTSEEVKEGIEMAMKGCEVVYEMQHRTLLEKFEHVSKEIQDSSPSEESNEKVSEDSSDEDEEDVVIEIDESELEEIGSKKIEDIADEAKDDFDSGDDVDDFDSGDDEGDFETEGESQDLSSNTKDLIIDADVDLEIIEEDISEESDNIVEVNVETTVIGEEKDKDEETSLEFDSSENKIEEE